MEIVREFKRPASDKLVLDIPEQFIDEELEILIIPVKNHREKKVAKPDKRRLFEQLCGLWEGRQELSLESIRKKAWKRD
jgi:hypothetical protein